MNDSVLIISQEAPYTFRVACADCCQSFDLFGQLKPADGNGASTIEQRICEHLDNCTPGRTKIAETGIVRSLSDKTLYRMEVRWT